MRKITEKSLLACLIRMWKRSKRRNRRRLRYRLKRKLSWSRKKLQLRESKSCWKNSLQKSQKQGSLKHNRIKESLSQCLKQRLKLILCEKCKISKSKRKKMLNSSDSKIHWLKSKNRKVSPNPIQIRATMNTAYTIRNKRLKTS